jgi:hypothetical protein
MIHDRNAAVPSEIPMDTVWSILEAANELGDAQTVEACRRVIGRAFARHPADAIRPQRGRCIFWLSGAYFV